MQVSFKPIVHLHRQRKDKNYSVIIRIGYKSKYAFIETNFSVPKSALSRTGEIKNQTILDKCNVIIKKYREKVNETNITGYTAKQIKSLLLDEDDKELDFIKIFNDYLKENDNSPSIGIYNTTYNHFTRVFGESLRVDDISPELLKKFENELSPNMGSRGVNLYLTTIRTIYNWMMDEYEYKGYTFRYPFRRYKIPSAKYPKTKALTKKQLKTIIEADITGIRANRARDIFIISLLSLGTNAKDLFLLEEITDRIEYKRSKTRNRRDDEAFISIKVEPELVPYLQKYKGKKRALAFSDMYKRPEKLNEAIWIGLKQMVTQINEAHSKKILPHIEYYDARRTIASVMRNKLGISKDDIAMCLNHVDQNLKTTDQYIEVDFSILDKSNRIFIDWLFDK